MVKMNIEWGDNHNIHGDEVVVKPVDGRIISATLYNIYGHYEPINLGTLDWMELPGRLRTHLASSPNMISSFAMLGTPHHDDATIAPEWAWAMWEELADVTIFQDMVF